MIRPAFLLFLALSASPLEAIPQGFFGNGFFPPVVPATPRLGANLTGSFLEVANWESGALPGPWAAVEGNTSQPMTANPILFGAVPDSAVARYDTDRLHRIDITHLDAGTFFRFKLGGEKSHHDRRTGREQRSESLRPHNSG